MLLLSKIIFAIFFKPKTHSVSCYVDNNGEVIIRSAYLDSRSRPNYNEVFTLYRCFLEIINFLKYRQVCRDVLEYEATIGIVVIHFLDVFCRKMSWISSIVLPQEI